MTGQRILGLDVGDRTVGVAASDLLLMTAQGVETIRRTSLNADMKRLDELMREYDAVRLVVGLPRNMNGTEGERCEIVRAFAHMLFGKGTLIFLVGYQVPDRNLFKMNFIQKLMNLLLILLHIYR